MSVVCIPALLDFFQIHKIPVRVLLLSLPDTKNHLGFAALFALISYRISA